MKLRIGITTGCPCGIGPEIVAKAIADKRVLEICEPVVFTGNVVPTGRKGIFNVPDLKVGTTECGAISLKAVEEACKAAMDGKVSAIVTAPINKSHWKAAGSKFLGHTEYLAHLSKAGPVAMMMASPRLKVSLVTTHLPLSEVSQAITKKKIISVVHLTDSWLRETLSGCAARNVEQLRLPSVQRSASNVSSRATPTASRESAIAVCALNPHAGDSCALGHEEKEIIIPAIEKLQAEGLNVTGPFSADTVFWKAVNGEFDAVVCMYHDQALVPIKTLDFKRTVNITLGLPFVRTSPDHGTAEDIAGKGIADPENFICAIEMAVDLCKKKNGLHTLSRATCRLKSAIHS